MNRSAVFVLFLISGPALLAQGPRGRGPGGPGPGGIGPEMMGRGGFAGGGPVISGAPYSATEVLQTSETLQDGNVIQSKRQTSVYRDSSGRVRTEETITPDASTGKAPYQRITILDYVAGKRYDLDSSTMTVREAPLHAPPARPANAVPGAGSGSNAGRRGPSGNAGNGGAASEALRPNIVRTALNAQMVNGVLSEGTQHSETIPAGAIGNARPIQTTRIQWVSKDLKVPVRIQSNDPRFGSRDMELTNIIQAEPSASLFVVPAGYTVKSGGQGFGGPRPMNRGPRPAGPPQR